MKFPERLYVPVVDEYCYPHSYDGYGRDSCDWRWTVFPVPDREGWENDSGAAGYGLPRELAEEIVRRYNTEPLLRGVAVYARVLADAVDSFGVKTIGVESLRQALAAYDETAG